MARAQASPACGGAPVSEVRVQTNRPQFDGPMRWWRIFARSMGLHHQTTDADLVRRFLTLDPGMSCTEFRRAESERILRAQPFLADATVSARRVGDSVAIDVETVDEVALVGAARVRGASVGALSLGTLNFAGGGMHVEGRWEQGRALRDGFGARLAHHQLLGRPYIITFDGLRRPLGEYYTTSLSHPFITDLQRVAWHAGYSVNKDFAALRRPDRSLLLQPVDRAKWHVGGVVRFGPPRRLGLIGGMILREHHSPRHEFLERREDGSVQPASDTTGVRRYDDFNATNVAGVLGLRALTFSRMRGLDALVAEQDVATGTQIAATLGFRPAVERPLRDAFGVVDAYAGERSAKHFVGARLEIESRLDLDAGRWRHMVASGRAAWYFKPDDGWVSELAVEGAGFWRSMLPVQIELGDRRSGVRGYARSHEAGGRRLLARLEQRFDVARYRGSRAAIGVAAFADAGRTWHGDVPFGTDTPIRASAGAAILAAVPARSQRTMRAEVALPLDRSTGARPELRFVVREPTRGFWFEPSSIRWARLAAVPEQIFSWP